MALQKPQFTTIKTPPPLKLNDDVKCRKKSTGAGGGSILQLEKGLHHKKLGQQVEGGDSVPLV